MARDDSTGDNERIADALAARGWAVCPHYFSDDMTRALRDDLQALQQTESLRAAKTGREGGASIALTLRTDQTLWLEGASPAQQNYLAVMEDLRLALNRNLFLGLFDYESHYALYQAGGFYKKHIDSLHGAKNRVVSCVTYLTEGWTEAHAGHLALYDRVDHAREIARVLPEAGTLAVFLSEDVPHEVLPPARERASIAGWFRCNGSGIGRVDPPR